MSPRVTLPGADELFRATAPAPASDDPAPGAGVEADAPGPVQESDAAPRGEARSVRRTVRHSGGGSTSGRERHDEKITVYVSAAELVELEQARLSLRAEHGIAVDRGRIVREALAVVLADLEAKHGDSILVRRLGGR